MDAATADHLDSRVLVVDDDPSVRSMIATVLGLEGFEVATATDGVEALRMVGSFEPDVIVLDVMMPRSDGYDVTRVLKSIPRLRNIPIVMCSALTSVEEAWKGWTLGVDSYLPKPFETEQLVREVLRLTTDKEAVPA